MNYNELIRKLHQSDEASWMECYDEVEGVRYTLRDDLSISVYLPNDINNEEHFFVRNENPNHPIGKKLMYHTDLYIHSGFIQYNSQNIIPINFYYHKGDACYLPPMSNCLGECDSYIVSRWVSDLALFMTDNDSIYWNVLELLDIIIDENLDY